MCCDSTVPAIVCRLQAAASHLEGPDRIDADKHGGMSHLRERQNVRIASQSWIANDPFDGGKRTIGVTVNRTGSDGDSGYWISTRVWSVRLAS